MPGETEFDYAPEYVTARAVLLDALDALYPHLPTIIIVGAQAVYLHTGAGDLVGPPMTTDGDLALNVNSLQCNPEITAAMTAADFRPGRNPGRWTGRGDVAVDIMVAPFQSGRTARDARSARLVGHEKWAARTTAGQRVKQKDSLDMLRLLQAVETDDLIAGVRLHLADEHAREVTIQALNFLKREGTSQESVLPMAATAVDGGNPTVAPSFAALTQDLLDGVERDLGVTPLG